MLSAAPSADPRQQHRDFLIAGLLAFSGGLADGSSYLLVHCFTGHITGNLVLAGIDLAQGHWGELQKYAVSILIFTSATIVGQRLPHWSRLPNGLLAMAQAVLFGVTPLLFRAGHGATTLAIACLSAGLGLQNGVFSREEGVGLHTTYVTGDLTILLKAAFNGDGSGSSDGSAPSRRLTLTIIGILCAGFCAGALCSGWLVPRWGERTIWALEPIVLLLLMMNLRSRSAKN